MLDEGPRDQPPDRRRPIPPTLSTRPTRGLGHRGWRPERAPVGAPAGPSWPSRRRRRPRRVAAPSTTDLIKADMSDAWARLDQSARLLVSGSVAAIVIVLVGLPLSVWDSAPFALLVLTASIITAITAWFGASPVFRDLSDPARHDRACRDPRRRRHSRCSRPIEILFDLDTDGIVGLVVGVALVGAATVVQVVAAQRRGADPLGVHQGRPGTKIAAVGLLLVLIGWAFNLSISFWTMGQAALPVAILTIAALTVAEAPRIQSPVPVAWVGAGIAVFGALLALAHWSDLLTLGRTELTLEPIDFLGLLAYSIGAVLIIVGGVLSGRDQWRPSAASTATPAAAPQPSPTGARTEPTTWADPLSQRPEAQPAVITDGSGATRIVAAFSRSGAPVPPYRSATTSARIARAVSAGARPPRSSPTGPCSLARSSWLTPASSSRRPSIRLGLARPDGARRNGSLAAAPRRWLARRT